MYTSRGWRFASGRVGPERIRTRAGLTPEAALTVQPVFQAKALLDQEIAGEQASEAQQEQMRADEAAAQRHRDVYRYSRR